MGLLEMIGLDISEDDLNNIKNIFVSIGNSLEKIAHNTIEINSKLEEVLKCLKK
jgi:hypothetical protein